MNIQKINWKLFINSENGVAEPSDFFKVFNNWIPDSPEVFIDVADYQHVFQGPLTLLAGHYEDYVYDAAGGRYGLQYNRKQPLEGSGEENIKSTLSSVLKAAKKLEEDPIFKGNLKFSTSEFLFLVNDRALAPNNKKSAESILPVLESCFQSVFPNLEVLYIPNTNPEERFSVEIKLDSSVSLDELISKTG